MAAEKSGKRRRKQVGSRGQGDGAALQPRDAQRSERRFAPKASAAAAVTMLGMSIGALLAGAGVYGQWLRGGDAGPHPYGVYLLAAGAALLACVGLFGAWTAKPVRVGDAGVAVETGPNELERLGWSEVTGVLLSDAALTIRGAGTTISIPRRAHAQAAAWALSEARARIPKLVGDIREEALGKPDEAAGEVRRLEPPQVAGLRCKETGKLIAFEADARLCGRCGEVYHKDGVPRRCATCDASLRG